MLDYLPMYLCHVLASEEKYMSRWTSCVKGAIYLLAVKAASIESST